MGELWLSDRKWAVQFLEYKNKFVSLQATNINTRGRPPIPQKPIIMATPHSKANVGMTLVILFLITLITGIILHLKSHGIIIQPRGAIKVVHWVSGLLMALFACWHGAQFMKMLTAMKTKFRWFWCDTWVAVVFITLTVLTGLVKLLSPDKIPHLGLWHYWMGIIMAVAIIVHLFRGLPSWLRLRKLK